jgi:CTP-dependent riboflavin kinase
LKKTKLDGILFTGEGNGKKYLALLWVKQQLEEKLGYTPYLGTLNLKLSKESTQRRKTLLKLKPTLICPPEGYCVGLLFKASIRGLECAVVVPQVKDYPEDVLEVIAPVNLRDTLKLMDGDVVNVSVQV